MKIIIYRYISEILEQLSLKLAGTQGCSLLWGEVELPKEIENDRMNIYKVIN